ncbi:MAG: hypothetical protein F4X34_01330 [Chloroflexi bacterium]|nr:hypothetical protein [Chloroflexota bacterium]
MVVSAFILWIHIAAGSVALLTAAIALITQKGGTKHIRAGRLYAASMTLVFLTAVPLAYLGSSVFLLLIAVFSFYLVFAGWRFARNYEGNPHIVDWAAITAMGLTGLGMWGYAAVLMRGGNSQWITMVLFGFIALALSVADVRFYRAAQTQSARRIARHLTNMMAGTIATITAVVVVNVDTNPVWLGWIMPTLLITPLIVWWNIRIARLGRNRPARS